MPSVRIFSSTNASSDSGFSSALVSWKRNVLLAEPPPLVTNRKWYSSPAVGVELDLRRQVGAGVHLLVHRRAARAASSAGWSRCRCRRCRARAPPRRRRPVQTRWPFLPITIAVPVSWHDGRTMPADDVGVLQHVEGDEAVVRRRLGVVEDRAQLREVAGAEEVRDVAHGLGGEPRQAGGVDREHALAAERARRPTQSPSSRRYGVVSSPCGNISWNWNSGMRRSPLVAPRP